MTEDVPEPDAHLLGRVIACPDHLRYLVSATDGGRGGARTGSGALRYPAGAESPGTFVAIPGNQGGGEILGMVISSSIRPTDGFVMGNTPDVLREEHVTLFMPEVVDGATRILEVRGIGWTEPGGRAVFGIPERTPSYLDRVRFLTDPEVKTIHFPDDDLHLEYYTSLKEDDRSQTRAALKSGLQRLMRIIPEEREILSLLTSDLG